MPKISLSEEHFPRQLQHEYEHTCDTDGCFNQFKNGDNCIQDARHSGWTFHYCSMECAMHNNELFNPKDIIWITAAETCGAYGCDTKLEIGLPYFRVIGWSSLCCSNKCAKDQFNLVWGEFEHDRGNDDMDRDSKNDDFKRKDNRWK